MVMIMIMITMAVIIMLYYHSLVASFLLRSQPTPWTLKNT